MNDKPTPFETLAKASERYGELSLENYARIRSLAEALSSGFCAFLRGGSCDRCCYLVPAEGAWTPTDYSSGAFSVSGQRMLPLGPIRFGLAVRVSQTGDWMRLVLTASKNGDDMDVHVQGGKTFTFNLPRNETQTQTFFEHLHAHLVGWFEDHVHHYEHGAYGGNGSMGFDILEAEDVMTHADETDPTL